MAAASLNTAIGKALDGVFEKDAKLRAYTRLKATGQELRRYFHEAGAAQREISFYRDKWWTKDGGVVYVELMCLVPLVQMAVAGAPQSLAAPDYSVPFTHFQYGTTEKNAKRAWELRSVADVAQFEAEVSAWLPTVATAWLEQFDSTEGVLEFMRRKRESVHLALVLAALGRAAEAGACVREWLSELPRQIEKPLAKLARAGLLSFKDEAVLARAALQSEERYRRLVQAWIADKEGT